MKRAALPSRRAPRLLALVVAACSLALGACGDDGKLCARNETQPCACPGGETGAQVCSPDGQGWESCVCGWPDAGTDAGSDAENDPGSDTGECGVPTLAQCQDPVWLENDPCGIVEHQAMQTDTESTCNQLLMDEADRLSETDEEVDVVLPDELGGGTTTAREEDNPDKRLDEVVAPLTYTGFTQETAVETTESGLSPAEQALRNAWNANGNRVASCREYVYEKYWDYARFQDAIAARHDEAEYVAEMAFGDASEPAAIGTHAAEGDLLRMRDGSIMTVQTLDSVVCYPIRNCWGGSGNMLPNIFMGIPIDVLRLSDLFETFDSGLRLYLENERCYMQCEFNPPPPWQWHVDQHAAVLEEGLLDVEMDAMYPRALAFREALDDFVRIGEATGWDCCPSTYENPPEPGSYCEPYYAECVSVVDRLLDLFEEAYEAGCIVSPHTGTTTVCDWSAAYFVESLWKSFDTAMEADYQRCLELTADDFEALSDYTFYLPTGPWSAYPAEDYAVTASAVDLFFSRHAEYREALFQFYLDNLPRDLFDEQTGEVREPGVEWSNSLESGNDAFGVSLDYLLSWGLTGFDPEGEQTPPDLCLGGFEAVGSLTLGGRAFWSSPVDIIDAYARIGLASGDGSEGHLIILGEEIWGQDPVEEWMIAQSWDWSRNLLEAEKVIRIYGVPVGRLTGGVAGTLGLEVGAEVTGGRVFDDFNHNGHVDPWEGESCSLDPTLHAWFAPWGQLEAFGSMAAYCGIAEVGVRVDVMLVRLDVPFTLDIGLSTAVEEPQRVVDFDVTVGADLVLRTLDGRLTAYAELGVCPFCFTAKKVLFSWTGLKWDWDLFETSYTVPLGYLLEAMRFE